VAGFGRIGEMVDARRRGCHVLARLGAVGALIALSLVGLGPTTPGGPAAAAENTTIEVVKALPSGRAADTDQFTVRVSEDGTVLSAGTTTGAGGVVDPGTGSTGPLVVDSSLEYAIDEVAAGTADLGQYQAFITCEDTEELTGALPNGAPLDAPFLLSPAEGSTITCTIANVPVAPTLALTKAFGSPRVEDTDQFYVAISRNSLIVADGLTTGSGTTVDPGSGTTGTFAATAGTTYELHELAQGTANSADYVATIDCIDANGFQTGLPEDAPLDAGGALPITPVAGAAISCTITNTVAPPDPTIRVVKALDGERIDDTDEFTVGVDGEGGSLGASTTTGSGADVDAGTGDTGVVTLSPGELVTVGEEEAGTTDLDDYAATITCEDANGLQVGLPDEAALDADGIELELTAGAAVTCTITNTALPPTTTIEVVKALGSDRAEPDDQFVVAIEGPNAFVATGVTAGTGSTIDPQTGTTGPVVVEAAFGYQVGEAGDGDTDLFGYTATVDCVDANGLQVSLPDDEPYPGPFSIEPTLGAEITCTITNTAIPPATTIQLDKALATYRAQLDDEFTVEITEDGTVVNDTTASTTAGVGADITAGTGTTGPFTATPGQTYALGEAGVAATDLADYTATIDCVDANELQTGLPDDAPYTQPVEITPVLGAAISCTITNTSATADISVVKQLAGPRHDDSDQFTVRLREGDTVIRSSTTGGIGSDVTIGTGSTGYVDVPAGTTYTIDELAVGTTDLTDYATTIGCVDSAGVTDPEDLPDGQDLTQVVAITPAPGALITCTVVNTPRPRIRVLKSLGTPRREPSDQFTVVVVTEDLTAVASSTTTGTGDTVDPGTGDTGAYGATVGVPYDVGELLHGTIDIFYDTLITCIDANGVQPDLPVSEPYLGPVTITPVAGADIVCTVVNRARPTIELSAAFATDRAQPGDQVTVGISAPDQTQPVARMAPGPDGPIVSDPTNATTSGTGSTVDPGTGTTGLFVARADVTYGIGQRAAGTTDLDAYNATLTCVDAAGLQTDLPTDEPLSGTIEITPVMAARISCTITTRASTAVVEDASITKEVVGTPTRVGTDGYDVAYRLTVENIGTVAMAYDLDDTLLFGAGVTITSATVANTTPGDIAVAADWDGRTQPLIVTAQPIAVGEVHVYDVTVRIVVEGSATATSIDCQFDPGETGTGITNASTLGAATSEAEATVAVCAAIAERDPVDVVDPIGPSDPFVPSPSGTGPLARTGAAVSGLVAIGLVLVAVGAVLAGRGRRRTTTLPRRHRIAALLDHMP